MPAIRSWKTSLAGVLGLLTIALQAIQEPAVLSKPEVITGIITSVGLIVAKDGNVTGGTLR